MNPASASPDAIFRCEQCGRHTWDDLFACPERPNGGCPFLLENVGGSRLTRLAAAVVFWALALGALWLARQPDDYLTRLVVLALAAIFGAAGLLGVVSLFSEPSYLLVNRATGASWHRIILAGWTISDQITLPTEPLPLDLPLNRRLHYPPSISALCPESGILPDDDRQRAIDITLHSLIALAAQGFLSVRIARRYDRYWGRPLKLDSVKYVLEPGPLADLDDPDGALEERLMAAVRQWPERTPASAVKIRRLAVSWQIPPRQGVEVDRLLAAIFDSDERDPYHQLVMLVEEDVLARGLCRRSDLLPTGGRAAYEIQPPHADRMREESEAVHALQAQLARTHPDLLRALRYAIDTGIESRQVD